MSWEPQRIVCLSAESVDMLYRLGVDERVVGVSGYTVFPPEARRKPFVSAFTTFRYDRIDALKPDLIIAFSDLQAEAAHELSKRGHTVLLTNQRTLSDMLRTLVMLGRIVSKCAEAESLARDLQGQLEEFRSAARQRLARPKVYFEEWNDPLITGIAWVSELIEAAGGDDIFRRRSALPAASQRIVDPQEVIREQPDLIIASWCGKGVDLQQIRERKGWQSIPAVQSGQIVEIESALCLQPGPSLITEGLPRLVRIIDHWRGPA